MTRSARAVATIGAILVLAAVLAGGPTKAWAQPSARAHTAAQAQAGRAVYATECAMCHGADLHGGAGPPLAGQAFLTRWSPRTASELFQFIQVTMPPGIAGLLSADDYLSVVAFILETNGAAAGEQALTAESAVSIGALAPATAQAASAAQAANAPQSEAELPPLGVMVAGTVANFVPLSDEKIRNPDPGDWPMIRRDYEASNYSPLDEITPQNVASLQLAWVWSMADRDGRDEPAPIAYDGVIYLNNPPNVMQALDGRTGKLIWQTRIAATLNFHPMRGSALAGDKIYVATNQAHLLALDARTGENVWETVVGERENGDFTRERHAARDQRQGLFGTGNCQQYRPDKCFISAYDAATGKELWRFRTVALDGEPGGDTWNGLPDLFRAGGDVWITGSYDPGLNLTYWGVAQAKPWMRASRQSGNGPCSTRRPRSR